MQFSKKIWILAAAVPLLTALGGCASKLIEVRPGSDAVNLAEPNQVSQCVSKGKTLVSVMSEVGFITRRPEDVEANMLQLARNTAVEKGADTVVKGNSLEYGKRTYELYKCKP